MNSIELLKNKIDSLNEKDYGAYQSLIGEYNYPEFKLSIDQIPKDPYAPSHTGIYRIRIKNNFITQFETIFNANTSETAFCDYLARCFYEGTMIKSRGRRGTGNSGIITIEKPGQAILKRNSVLADKEAVEVRFFMGLPADDRRINSKTCSVMFFNELPEIARFSLFPENIDLNKLKFHIEAAEDAEFIRSQLDSLNLVSFIANGSILPRKSGTSDEPLPEKNTVTFASPESLLTELNLPHAGKTKGMGIPRGITLIAGGGYHGKTTLLNSIEMGIYNHIPGDGREKCISDGKAIKIRSYSGRYIEKVDISMFINNLPFDKNTAEFSTENASGSTSQAASIMEAIEAGADVFLMDEDTCATNFMIRDQKMQKLVQKSDEPITAFIDRVENIYSENGISTILVLGGIGDYFEVSDTVIQMKNYLPVDVTTKAHDISKSSIEKRLFEGKKSEIKSIRRVPLRGSIDPYNDYHKKSVYVKDLKGIKFGKTMIDLGDVEQLIELSQVKTIGAAIMYMDGLMDNNKSLNEIVEEMMDLIDKNGFDILSEKVTGNFSQFRGIDLAFAINRLRDLKIK